MQTEQTKGVKSALSYTRLGGTTWTCGRLEGRYERPAVKIWRRGVHLARREVSDSALLNEILTQRNKKQAPVSLISSEFLLTISTWPANCSAVLRLNRNLNCSSHSRPRLFTSLGTGVSWAIRNSLPSVKQTGGSTGQRQRGVSFRFQYVYHASVFPCSSTACGRLR
jgi:hypothetical protein